MNYKKTIVITSFLFFFGFLFNFAPSNAKAMTVAEIQAQIQQLLQQITQLQQQLASMTGQSVSWCHNFNTNLRIGDTGSEVEALQTALKKEGFTLGDDKTGEFGEYTASAVVAFQEKYRDEILTPWGLAHGSGFVGRTTRDKLNKLYGCGVQPPTEKYIKILSPNGGEKWVIGNTYPVKFTCGQGISNVYGTSKVYMEVYDYNYNGTGRKQLVEGPNEILSCIPGTTIQDEWTIRSVSLNPGDYFKIKLRTSDNSASDESDNYFTITSSPSLLNKLNKDVLLHKLFPNLSFKNGVADLASAGDTEYSSFPGLKFYLKNSIEDYFTNNQEKNLLLVVQLDGVPHAGGLYHAYLGLFDKNGNLLTPSSPFPKPNAGDNYYDFVQDFQNKVHFGGDNGEFGFYDCKGVKYILFVSHGCPNGSCCDGGAELFRINNGKFEKVQMIDSETLAKLETRPLSMILPIVNAARGPSYGLKMIISGDKILVKKVPETSDNGCPETDYKELKWNGDTCRFE